MQHKFYQPWLYPFCHTVCLGTLDHVQRVAVVNREVDWDLCLIAHTVAVGHHLLRESVGDLVCIRHFGNKAEFIVY